MPYSQTDSSSKPATSVQRLFRATTLIGGSSAISIILSILRTKVLAIYLGPSGIGLLSIYGTIMSTVAGFAGLGLQYSGVRQLSVSLGSEDQSTIGRTRSALQSLTLLMAVLGILFLLIFSKNISEWTFGKSESAFPIVMLSIGVGFTVFTGAQTAVLTAYQRIAEIAKMMAWGALAGTIYSIAIAITQRGGGIIFIVTGTPVISFLFIWWYYRTVPQSTSNILIRGAVTQWANLVRLGIASMFGSLFAGVTLYLVRIMLIRHGGVEENGYFQAAWALCSLPVGILLNASYSEFYPEIARLSKDGGAMSNIANEYIDLSLHMFYPIAAAMVTFSQYLIALLYSEDFLFAVDTLQWLALSILFRVSSFGLTNIIHARGKALIFTLVEFIHNAAFVLLTYTMLNNQGLKATGIAFLLSQVLYFIVALSLAKREIGFKIKKRVIISMFSVCSVLFVVIYINLMNPKFALFAGTGVTVALLFKYFRYAKRMGLFSLGKFLG